MNLEKSDFVPVRLDIPLNKDVLTEIGYGLYKLVDSYGIPLFTSSEKCFSLKISNLPVQKIRVYYNWVNAKPIRILMENVILGAFTHWFKYTTKSGVDIFLPEDFKCYLEQLKNAILEKLSLAEEKKNDPELAPKLFLDRVIGFW